MAGPMLHTGQSGRLIPKGRRKSERLEIRAYRILTRLARPAAPYILRFRERRGKEDPQRRGERLGRASLVRPDGAVVWVHAASVGETSAVLPLMARLMEHRPGLTLLLTTGTVTSARFAAGRLGSSVLHQYIPLDEPSFVASFLDYWRPSLGVFTEQEVWPNLVVSAAARSIPLAVVNARMSDRSFERWQRRAGLATALFSRFDVVLAQSEALANRFEAVGAPCVITAGNLKIDAPAPPIEPRAFAALREVLGERPRLIAASTHDDEELTIAMAHQAMRQRIDGLVTVIAPRHPERGGAVADAISALGLSVRRRSAGELPESGTDVYVADTIGELGTFYAVSPVAFIGGSLIAHGGQNPIEAVRRGAVVVAGPNTQNFVDIYEALLASGGAAQVSGRDDLAPALEALLTDHLLVERMRGQATRALDALSGALDRTVEALLPLIPEGVGSRTIGGG